MIVDTATCVKSINPISSLLSSKCNIWSIRLDCFAHTRVKATCSPALEFFFLRSQQHPALIYASVPFSLTAGRYLSNGSPSVPADIVLPLFTMLIYQLSFIRPPSCHYSQSTHSRDTVVTELGSWGRWEWWWWGLTETKMMSAVSLVRCISAEHEIFSLYMNVQCHFLLPESAWKAFLILLWFLLHEWLMCSTKDM